MNYKAVLDTEVPEGCSLLAELNQTGDTRVTWRRGNANEEAVARAAFDSAKSRGMMAYRVTGADGRGEVMRDFDAAAEKIILAPPLAGG